MEANEEVKESPMQKYISIFVTVMLVLAVVLCLYVVVQVLSNGFVNIGGFMMFRVVTGSMEPTIPVGALMVTREAAIDTIALNDIVCFRTRESEIWGKIVTHRVVNIQTAMDGSILLETRGDANLVVDGYYVTADNLVGKVIWHTGENNFMADIFSFLTSQVGFLAVIVFPCLLLAGLILKDCVRNIRGELEAALRELEEPQSEPEADWENDPLCGMTQEEYQEMYERIRAELIKEIEELMHSAQIQTKQ